MRIFCLLKGSVRDRKKISHNVKFCPLRWPFVVIFLRDPPITNWRDSCQNLGISSDLYPPIHLPTFLVWTTVTPHPCDLYPHIQCLYYTSGLPIFQKLTHMFTYTPIFAHIGIHTLAGKCNTYEYNHRDSLFPISCACLLLMKFQGGLINYLDCKTKI